MSERSRDIWLLRFFGLSSGSKRFGVLVENDDKLWRDVRSSLEPNIVWKARSENFV